MWSIKNVSLFEYIINQIINLYENGHKTYIKPQFSVNNISHYTKNNNIKNLINFNKLFNIYGEYAKYINTKEFVKNKDAYLNEEEIFIKEIKNSTNYNQYEPDYISDSSVENDEEINFI